MNVESSDKKQTSGRTQHQRTHSAYDSRDRDNLYKSGQKKTSTIQDKENVDPLTNQDCLISIEKAEQICLRIVDCDQPLKTKPVASKEDESLSFRNKSKSVC